MQVALQVSTNDLDEGCRTAARELLGSAPLAASALAPLLALPAQKPPPKRGRTPAKKAKSAEEESRANGTMSLPIAVLELLQWRGDVEDAEALLQHISSLLTPLLSMAAEQAHTPAATDEEGTDRYGEFCALLCV